MEYEGEISNGDPIMLICEFTLDDPKSRAAKLSEAREKIAAIESGEWSADDEESDSSDILDELLDD